jgi:ribosomal 50S subunit-recycling heat shock protein
MRNENNKKITGNTAETAASAATPIIRPRKMYENVDDADCKTLAIISGTRKIRNVRHMGRLSSNTSTPGRRACAVWDMACKVQGDQDGILCQMRLDRFMKVARLAKRRTEAHEALEHGRITKDGKTLKPAYHVKPGDVLRIHYATRYVTVRVREVPLRMTPGVRPTELYEILETEPDDPVEWT